MSFYAGTADVAVIGAGHAGIEAALSCARLGLKVICFSTNLDVVGNMPCNPAIGGTGKGQLVREIDALGGEMARAADDTCIQYRMLNGAKGPAVHSLRAQADRRRYQERMKSALETHPNILLRQAEITGIGVEGGAVHSVTAATGAVYRCTAAVICTGTFLGGKVIIGEMTAPSGPDGLFPSIRLIESLRDLGIPLQRFKTGTPPRVAASSIDFSVLAEQEGEEDPSPFSFRTETPPVNRAKCHIAYTNENTHRIIRENLHLAPMYSGLIEGTGARYCPSIEDKVVRFKDKERHQIFIEPMGLSTEEMYIQGFSSSMPERVQVEMLRSIKGFERAEIMRPAYAIEYDCADPLALKKTLEFKNIRGLFGAGQFNGTSGYEEAAAQGLIAGINAAMGILEKEPLILGRDEAYIGVLIDDLVTKGTREPYRMMTSRAEYRLTLRQDNADLRLSGHGLRVGLVGEARHQGVLGKYAMIEREIARIGKTMIPPSDGLSGVLAELGGGDASSHFSVAALLRRPGVTYDALAPFDPERPALPKAVRESVEINVKYEGYIKKECQEIKRFRHMESRAIPENLDYSEIRGLRIEARQKLSRVRPETLGQAARISGVSPADITALVIQLKNS